MRADWVTDEQRRAVRNIFEQEDNPPYQPVQRVCPLQLYSPRTPCNFVFFLVLGWFGIARRRGFWSSVPGCSSQANAAETRGLSSSSPPATLVSLCADIYHESLKKPAVDMSAGISLSWRLFTTASCNMRQKHYRVFPHDDTTLKSRIKAEMRRNAC